MGPALAGALPAIIGGIGGLIGGATGNRARRQEARRNRRFQERMRNTEWQAAVADMTAAGINPALAYAKGGATSPGGSLAQQGDAIGEGISSAMQAKRLSADVKLLRTQTQAAAQQARKTSLEAENQAWMNRLWGGMTGGPGQIAPRTKGPLWKLHEANATNAQALARINQLQIPSMKNLANIAGSKPGQNLAWIKYLLNLARPGGGR